MSYSRLSKTARSSWRSTRPIPCATPLAHIAISKAARLPDRQCSSFRSIHPHPPAQSAGWVWMPSSSIHRVKELGVALRFLELVDQEFEPVDGSHRGQHPAQHPHLGQDAAVDQQLLFARAGFGDVDRREGALVGDLAVEHDFRIAGALE